MNTTPVHRAPERETILSGELVNDGALAPLAAEVARRQAAPLTRMGNTAQIVVDNLPPDVADEHVVVRKLRAS